MKAILIDDIGDLTENQCEFTIDVKGEMLRGYQIAKPLNYDKEYTTKADRKKMAKLILEGKAIAVQFFSDLSEEEQSKYVEDKIK